MNSAWFITGPFMYIAVIAALAATTRRLVRYMSMPRHLRWDLYPVPHQGNEGSKYQQVDFYKLPPHFSISDEAREMLKEMIFIKKLFVNNPKLWTGSFLLHIGTFLSIFWFKLVVIGAILNVFGFKIAPDGSIIGIFIYYLTLFAGTLGSALGLIGSVLVLAVRLTDTGLKEMSDPVTYFNLLLMALLFLFTAAAWLTADSGFHLIRDHFKHLIVLSPQAPADSVLVWQILTWAVFILYLPFSRMSHYMAKYFFYHKIMWDDEPVKSGGALERSLKSSLTYRLNWSAGHIKQGRSWLEQVETQGEKEHG